MLDSGTLLQNRYRIIRPVGKGGMGAVYEAEDLRLKAPVAIKQTILGDPMFNAALTHEAQILAALRHPMLPVVSDYFDENNALFLVMQLISGPDLATLLAQQGRLFPPDQVLRWADQLLQALEYLHRQQPPVIHRDIKPQNLKLTPEGVIMLLDFGLAKGAPARPSQTGSSIFGYTPQYAPLEQIRGEGTDVRSDLYAFGATLYELLTGTKPPDAVRRVTAVLAKHADPLRPAHELNSQIAPAVARLLLTAMAIHPQQRPASAATLRVALHHARDDQATEVGALQPSDARSRGKAFPGISVHAGARTGIVPEMPTGTVTFLCADIDGSTGLRERLAHTMSAVIARCDAILRGVIEAHGGYVFRSTVETFGAAFATAPPALAAALVAQRALAAEVWEVVGSLKMRMALHTGAAETHDRGYLGSPLNRVTRMVSAGFGGQTLLSAATWELVRDELPPGTELRDLGEHRLTDLIRPDHIFQLVAPDLPANFPPLKTLDTRPNNLPAQPTPLIGRERELAAASTILSRADVRLLTFVGPGGTGKTRLALQIAADLLESFADGIFFVSLVPIRDPALVLPTIAQVLKVHEAGSQPLLETIKAHLRDKQILLLLDNFEQVIAAAPAVTDLLAAAQRLKILVTSREVLHVYGEHDFLVPSLALPDVRHVPPIERLTQYEAVRLFIERAQAIRPEFQVTNANAPAVAEICARLDGLPLAIELAAARSRLLPPQALLERLSSRLRLLTGGARDLPAHQQTLRSTIDWSYNLLDPAEQMLFRRLAVFVGGRSLEAVEAVCNAAGDLPLDVLDGLQSLLNKSLLQQPEDANDEPRFLMLETIWEYAVERLDESGEANDVRRAHAAYYLSLAERAEPELIGPNQGLWLDRLELEHNNLRAALHWAVEAGEVEMGLRIGAALSRFWWARGHVSEGRQWLELALSHAADASTSVRAKALNWAGYLTYTQNDYVRAVPLHEESLALCQELEDKRGVASNLNNLGLVAEGQGDYARAKMLYEESLTLDQELGYKRGIAASLHSLAWLAYHQGDYVRATALYEESLELDRELKNKQGIAATLNNLGIVAEEQGDYARAIALYEESLAVERELGNKHGIANSLNNLGVVAWRQGNYTEATLRCKESLALYRQLEDKRSSALSLDVLGAAARGQGDFPGATAFHEESLMLFREAGYKRGIILALNNLGLLAYAQGNYAQATVYFRENLNLCRELDHKVDLATCLRGLANVAATQGRTDRATRLFAAAAALREAIGAPLPPIDQADYERHLAKLHAQMDETAFAAAWAAGRAMTIEEAIAYALEEEV